MAVTISGGTLTLTTAATTSASVVVTAPGTRAWAPTELPATATVEGGTATAVVTVAVAGDHVYAWTVDGVAGPTGTVSVPAVSALAGRAGVSSDDAVQAYVQARGLVDRTCMHVRFDATDTAVQAVLTEAAIEQACVGIQHGDYAGIGTFVGAGGFTLGRLSAQSAPAAVQPVKVGLLWQSAYDVLNRAGLTGGGGPSSW